MGICHINMENIFNCDCNSNEMVYRYWWEKIKLMELNWLNVDILKRWYGWELIWR